MLMAEAFLCNFGSYWAANGNYFSVCNVCLAECFEVVDI